jgi:hypothetical protein
MRKSTSRLVILPMALALWAAPALAMHAVETPRLQIGAVGTTGLAVGDFSRQDSNDTVSGTSTLSLAGGGLQAHLRLGEHLVAGVAGQWSGAGGERQSANVDGGPGNFRRHLAAFAAEARWQFAKVAGMLPWVSAGLGAALARDQWQADGQEPGNAWQIAPALGAAAGFDVPLTRAFAIGLELRSHAALFGESPPDLPGLAVGAQTGGGTVQLPATRYGPMATATGAVVLRWRGW